MTSTRTKAKRGKRKVETADRHVARATGGKRDSSVVKAIGQVSELADQPPLIALSAATIAVGLLLRRGRVVRVGARMLASHWLATQAKSLVKQHVDRTRPFVMLGGETYHARKGHSPAKRENSFPSGHTAGAVAVARAVARDYPASAQVGYAAATAAGAIQLPRGAHYLSDVVVGAAIGWLAEAAVRLILPPAPAAGERGSGSRRDATISAVEPLERGEPARDRAPALDAGLVAGERKVADPCRDEQGGLRAIQAFDRERLDEPLFIG
ncbi:phosphatase PAP2 family protein [Sphingomonas montanisoli]|uniref:Phosphatase PAP2 family protein n=1 Tax=Sphingomonas montanisoli TaxID=2606412 RepID=A0A5D9C2B5_9SPHN|nr:phosphatase PAP2 family protein [Sphingomonas montanisoli]